MSAAATNVEHKQEVTMADLDDDDLEAEVESDEEEEQPHRVGQDYVPKRDLESTFKPLWARVMPTYPKIDDLTIQDLRGDNEVALFSTFVNKMSANTPIKPNRTDGLPSGKPYAAKTLKGCISGLVHFLRHKFRNAPEPIFADTQIVKEWQKKVVQGRSRSYMEGAGDHELFKSCFPIPTHHGPRTQLLPDHDFQSEGQRTASRTIDMCSTLANASSGGSNLKRVSR